MTRLRALSRRVGRAEAAGGPATPPVPCIVTVGTHDTPSAALAAFAAAYPDRPRRHAPLVVPARATSTADREQFVERFRASQLQLVAEARSERAKIAVEAPMVAPLDTARASVRPAATPAHMRGGSTFTARSKLPSKLFANLAGIGPAAD